MRGTMSFFKLFFAIFVLVNFGMQASAEEHDKLFNPDEERNMTNCSETTLLDAAANVFEFTDEDGRKYDPRLCACQCASGFKAKSADPDINNSIQSKEHCAHILPLTPEELLLNGDEGFPDGAFNYVYFISRLISPQSACANFEGVRYFTGANFGVADTKDIDENGPHFEGTDLRYIDLSHSWLDYAKFNNATLPRGSKASFSHARAFGANFDDVSYELVDRSGKIILPPEAGLLMQEGTWFFGAQLTGASFSRAKITGAIFTDSILDDASFVSADIRNSSFSGASLINADFSRAQFSNAAMNFSQAENAFFIGTDISGAQMRNVDFENAIFIGPEEGTKFNENYKTSVAFAGAWNFVPVLNDSAGRSRWYFTAAQTTDRVDFSGSNFSNAVLSRFNFQGAKLCDINDDDEENANNGSRYYDNKLDELLEPTDDGYIEVKAGECVPSVRSQTSGTSKYATFKNAKLDGADFDYVNASHLNFDNADFSGGYFTGTNFTGASLIQVNFYDAELDKTNFTNANLTMAYAMGSMGELGELNLETAKFSDSIVQSANFTNGIFSEKTFKNSDLSFADFTNAVGISKEKLEHHGNKLCQTIMPDGIPYGKC